MSFNLRDWQTAHYFVAIDVVLVAIETGFSESTFRSLQHLKTMLLNASRW